MALSAAKDVTVHRSARGIKPGDMRSPSRRHTLPGMDPSSLLHIRSGELLALRLFDIAYSIDLTRAAELWSARAGRE
ncbi:MAG: hypothetical protein IJI03_10370, partial [Rudaea sp.]|nr:hypothetical protein [Rudaea sp.]